MAVIDHNNEETVAEVLDRGFWAGFSIYPSTKMGNARMVAHSGGKESGSFEVRQESVGSFLSQSRSLWNLVLIDPPYSVTNEELQLVLETLCREMTRDGVIVVERSARDPLFTSPDRMKIIRTKDYGDTVLVWLEIVDY
jgi:16S rRNA G966 N2-methylase RsmD